MAKKQPPLEAPSNLVVEDWDFSDCPAKELHACRFYEYAREKPSLKFQIAMWRAHGDWSTRLPRSDLRSYGQQRVANFFCGLEEFPKPPWLKIAPHKREERWLPFIAGPFTEVCPKVGETKDGCDLVYALRLYAELKKRNLGPDESIPLAELIPHSEIEQLMEQSSKWKASMMAKFCAYRSIHDYSL